MFPNPKGFLHRHNDQRIWLGILVLVLISTACRFSENLIRRSLISNLGKHQGGLIVYTGNDGNIYSVDQSGEDLHAITNDAQNSADSQDVVRFYRSPTWSPDSEMLAFIGTEQRNGRTEKVSLFTAGWDGKDLQEVYVSDERTPFYLYWAPESERITFLSPNDGGDDLVLQMVSAQGGKVQELGTGQPYYWVWSPEGGRILTHTGGAAAINSDAQLSFLNLAADVTEERLSLRPGVFQAPDWSMDGKELLFSAEGDDGQRGLFLADQQGSVEKIITTTDGALAFSWSPQGRKLAYITDPNPATQILSGSLIIVNPDVPGEVVTSIDDQVIAFFWSPDASWIAYFVPVTEPPREELVQRGDSDPALSLSLRLLTVETGASREVTLFVPTAQFLNILPFFDQYQRSTTMWSPDSQHLVYSALDGEDKAGIYVAEVAGGKPPTRIADGQLAFWSWK